MVALARKLIAPSIGSPASAWRPFLRLVGPGCIVAVGYVDPGNWATDIAAGWSYGLGLLSAVLIASLLGAIFQALAIRLALATGKDLAALIRAEFPRPAVLLIWGATEIALVATDLAELLGSAVALQLLFGLPIPTGVVVGAILTALILALPGAGGRASEIAVGVLMSVVVLGLTWELALAQPALGPVLTALIPRARIVTDPAQLYLSLGILGATIMPHNLFLHGRLALDRAAALARDERASGRIADGRRTLRLLTLDSSAALALAFVVNGAILVVAAVAFQGGTGDAPGIADAGKLLGPALGSAAAGLVFALALLAAGQSATATGTMAGQIVTEGFLGLRLAAWQRALVTRGAALVPALALPLVSGGTDTLIILSQVVLGLTLPFALVPMLLLLRNRRLMGGLALAPGVLRAAGVLVLALAALNGWLAGTSFA